MRGRGGCGGQESISCDLCVFVKADGVQYKTRVVPRVFVLPIARRAHNATIRELKSYAEVQKISAASTAHVCDLKFEGRNQTACGPPRTSSSP